MTNSLFQASDLTHFFSKSRRAQELLPELIERLVHESAPLAEATFPWGNHISKPGYDGEVSNPSPHIPHVPQGKSVWEMGINEKPKEKFREDLTKRSKNPLGYDPAQTIFCFVTPQKFDPQKKLDEIQKSPDKDQWQEIKIYDTDDLRGWLKTCPKTELWIAAEIGALPKEEIERLQDFYTAYAAISPATQSDKREILPPALFLSGREENIKHFQNWLSQERAEKPYVLEAETAKEAAAFIFASLYWSPLYPITSLVVHSKGAAEALARKDSTANKNLLLILASPDINESLCQPLTNKGWKVVWAVGAEYRAKNKENILSLPWRKDLSKKLRKSFPVQNQQDYEWAGKIATQSGRSLNRLLALLRNDQSRKREEDEKLTSLLPAILVGGWVSSYENGWANPESEDQEILTLLSGGKKWTELENIFHKEATDNRLDGKLIKIGERKKQISWHIRSPQTELTALTTILFTEENGENFKQACIKVLGSIPAKEPFFSSLIDEKSGQPIRTANYSPYLRDGLTQSLAIMGSFPEKLPGSETMRSWAREIAAEIFDSKETDLFWWGHVHDLLSLLAEANPEAFLERLRKLLQSYPDAFKSHPKPAEDATAEDFSKNFLENSRKYLRDRGNAVLWTLGMLAWIPSYFDQSVDVLARICALAGKKSSFRHSSPNPPEALEKIFAPWNPQAGVCMKQRHKALKRIVKNHPDIGWNIFIEMLPQTLSAIMFPSSRPNWREFHNNIVTWQEWAEDIKFAANELVKLAEADKSDQRWAELITKWEGLFPHKNPCHFLEDWRLQTLATLKKRLETTGSEMKQFRTSLYAVLAKPRVFENRAGDKLRTDWALSEGHIKELEKLQPLLEPTESKEKFLWAFERKILSHIEINAGLTNKKLSNDLRLEQQQTAAKIIKNNPPEKILELAQKIKHPDNLGRALAELDTEKARKILGTLLNLDGKIGENVNFGLFQAHPKPEEASLYAYKLWQQAIEENWGHLAEIRLLSRLPASLELWKILDTRPEEIQKHYWQNLHPAFIAGEIPAKEVFKRFHQAKRPEAALKWVLRACQPQQTIEAQEIITLLEEVDPQINDLNQGILSEGLDNYTLGELLNLLEKANVPCETLAKLEMKYYSLLQYSPRGIKNIFEVLSKNPDFFVNLALSAYFDESKTEAEQREEDKTLTEEEKRKSLMAFNLLEDWMKYNPWDTPEGREEIQRRDVEKTQKQWDIIHSNPYGSKDYEKAEKQINEQSIKSQKETILSDGQKHFEEFEFSYQPLRLLPGSEGSSFSSKKLYSWIKHVQEKLKDTGREESANSKIGEIFAQMASFQDIVTFPEGFPEIFEEFTTKSMEDSFRRALYNRRGLVTKSMFEGGQQEDALAKKYLKGADKLEEQGFPKIAEILKQLGKNYKKEAEEANNAANRQDLTGVISF